MLHQRLKTLLGIGIALAVMGVAGIWLAWWWQNRHEPQRLALLLIDAVQREDWDACAQLVHPTEREELGLTRETVRQLGKTLITPLWKQLGEGVDVREAENPFWLTPEEASVYLKDAYVYQVVRKDGSKGALLLVEKTKEGWKVNFTLFVYTLLSEAATKGKGDKNLGLRIMHQLGIRALFVKGHIFPLVWWSGGR